jgi:hypothetical protein
MGKFVTVRTCGSNGDRFSVPLFLFFLDSNYEDGTLTMAWALYMALIWALLGVVGAGLVWHTISSPLIKRRRDKL